MIEGPDDRKTEIRDAVTELLDNLSFLPQINPRVNDSVREPGIYVLFLEGGRYYVGLAVNISLRMRQHLAGAERTNRIEYFRYLPTPEKHLRRMEEQVLERVEDTGAPVMNIDLARRSVTSRPLDELVDSSQHDAWVLDPKALVDTGSRRDQDLQRLKYADRYERFLRKAEAKDAVAFLLLYVQAFIPCPRATEGEYYAVSCLPGSGSGRGIVRVNAGRQELAAMTADETRKPYFYIMTPVISLRHTLRRLLKQCPGLRIEERAWRAGGRDQGAVVADSLQDLTVFLSEPVVAQQLRRFSLRIMLAGRAFWRNAHCPQLLDGIL